MKLTRKKAKELSEEYDEFRIDRCSNDRITESSLYYFLKEKGWIKKTAKEELEEYLERINTIYVADIGQNSETTQSADKLKELIKKIIEERDE